MQKDSLPNIGFSNESRFVFGLDKCCLWHQKGIYNKNAVSLQTKYAISIMAWEMIALNYKPEIFIFSEYENSETYFDMLK